MSTAKENISALRNEMSDAGIDVYIVPTSDFHDSEYVSPSVEARKILSGLRDRRERLLFRGKKPFCSQTEDILSKRKISFRAAG